METNIIGVFKPPSDVEFKLKTEVSQVAIYPIYNKNKTKVIDKMQLNLTVYLTIWMNGYLVFSQLKKIIRQEISTEEMNELINHLKNNNKNGTNRL